jgi:transposase
VIVDYCRSYQKLETHCKIAGCNAHIERYLRRLINDFKVIEAQQMKTLLNECFQDRKYINNESVRKRYLNICDAYLSKYQSLNKNDKYYYRDAYLLFKRLKEKQHQHLAFLEHDVPYTNNLIEQDFRHVKTKMKVSGTFRS